MVIGHGGLALALVETAIQIVGEIEAIKGIDFLPHEGKEKLLGKIIEAIKEVDKGQGAILLTDLFGGCCCNVSASLSTRYPVKVISGVNLSMLLEVIFHRESPLEELESLAVKGGMRGIVDVCKGLDRLSKKRRESEPPFGPH